jgi:uncharacterized protein (DUF433 family)
MKTTDSYKHLEPRQGSRYRQLFMKGRKLPAEIVYRQTVGEDPRTPEEVARDYKLPVEAVLEAIQYSIHNADLLRKEREAEQVRIREFEALYPPVLPPDYQPEK